MELGQALYVLVVCIEGAVEEIEKDNPQEAKRLLNHGLDLFFTTMKRENPWLFKRYFEVMGGKPAHL